MTMVINILHKDFTLLAADRRGFARGPFTLSNGSESVTCPYDANLDCLTKITLANRTSMAIGIAGALKDHTYRDHFRQSDSPAEFMQDMRYFTNSFFDFKQRGVLLAGQSPVVNQYLLTFFDHTHSTYFTQINSFSRLGNSTTIEARKCTDPGPSLFCIGEGAVYFSQAVGPANEQAFFNRVAEGAQLDEVLQWVTMVFEKTAALTPSCSSMFDAVLSTRTQPVFFPITPEHPATLSFPGVQPGTIFVESKPVAPESEVATNLHKRGLKEMFINFFNRSNW